MGKSWKFCVLDWTHFYVLAWLGTIVVMATISNIFEFGTRKIDWRNWIVCLMASVIEKFDFNKFQCYIKCIFYLKFWHLCSKSLNFEMFLHGPSLHAFSHHSVHFQSIWTKSNNFNIWFQNIFWSQIATKFFLNNILEMHFMSILYWRLNTKCYWKSDI